MILALLATVAATAPNPCAVPADRIVARECDAARSVNRGDYNAAALAFDQAAREAAAARDAKAATLWLQAGNAALAGGEPAKALPYLDAALGPNVLAGEALGEAYLDRARAKVALGQLPDARGDLDQALRLVPADPLGWLLSATLARRLNDLTRAASDIKQASSLAPDDANVALEAGNIAVLGGKADAARAAWQNAIKLQPGGAAAKAAADSLARLN